MTWVIITGEYPPSRGGVSDYTADLASSLDKEGEDVHVIAPAAAEEPLEPGRVRVHRLPDRYGPASAVPVRDILASLPRPRRLLVQYVPQAYGWKAMNLPFCIWLHSLRKKETLWTMFHEVAVPIRRDNRLRTNIVGVVTAIMAHLVARSSERIFLSTSGWRARLLALGIRSQEMEWLPIPSNLPTVEDYSAVARLRDRLGTGPSGFLIGHFGTFGAHVLPVLKPLLVPLLAADPRRSILLLGRGGDAFAGDFVSANPELGGRICAPGFLSAAETARHLAACDLVLQPYADGVSTKRSTMMAALSLGLPVVTNCGSLTEPIWSQSQAVALARGGRPEELLKVVDLLLKDRSSREALGKRGRQLYRAHFAMERTLEKLLHSETSNLNAA